MNASNNTRPTILIAEDDREQMDVLGQLIVDELKKLTDSDSTSESRLERLKQVQIAKVTNISDLKKVVEANSNLILAVMDCNMPDVSGGEPDDQFVKINHRIIGQHNAVDAVISKQPVVPITMISSLNRFRNLVTRFYKSKHDISINFISKSEQTMIRRNIAYYIRQYLRSTD